MVESFLLLPIISYGIELKYLLKATQFLEYKEGYEHFIAT